MKNLFFYIGVIVCLNIKSQTWVEITDAAFANYLHNNIPTAMQGDSLNTSSALVTTITHSINISDLGVSNLNGIQYFTSLTYLNCSGNSFSSFPSLPNTLTFLDCSYNSKLTTLPVLPNSVKTIWCQYDSLVTITSLPNQLQTLYCFNNYLTTLPALPNTLKTLECYYNSISSIPALPAALNQLDCYYNAITTMPPLNNALINLDCHNNYITSFSTFNNSLSSLYCSNNSLMSIPALPASLTNLDCDNNNLTNLPVLPVGLTYLDCSYNQLTELPALPSLTQLYCENNNITCFPTFPNTIQLSYFNSCLHNISYFINISNNPNTCVPNIIGAMGADSVNYQVCKSGNANGCAVTGINRLKAINDAISVYPNPASNSLQVVFTDNSGVIEQATIYDINGKLVSTPTLYQPDANAIMDVSGLPAGVYTISIISNLTSIRINKKLVIVK